MSLLPSESRGCYEASGHHILRAAHIGLEGLTMDREVRRVRDDLGKRYSELLCECSMCTEMDKMNLLTSSDH